jgi:hypothetical protein
MDRYPFKDDDVVFFDDSLHSQYAYFNQHKMYDKPVSIILGLSPAFICPPDELTTIHTDSITSHKMAKEQQNYSSFMSLTEIQFLLNFDNVYLALHGYKHADLRESQQPLHDFIIEVGSGLAALIELGLPTPSLYLYPYNSKPGWADSMLKRYKIIYSEGPGRIAVEELL